MARDDDDPLFAGFLSWWGVLGLLTAFGLANVEPRPLYEELPDAWVKIADTRPKARIVRPAPAPPKPTVEAPRSGGAKRPAGARRPGRTLAERIVGTTGPSDLVTRLW